MSLSPYMLDAIVIFDPFTALTGALKIASEPCLQRHFRGGPSMLSAAGHWETP